MDNVKRAAREWEKNDRGAEWLTHEGARLKAAQELRRDGQTSPPASMTWTGHTLPNARGGSGGEMPDPAHAGNAWAGSRSLSSRA